MERLNVSTEQNKIFLEELHNKIPTGNAILFTGAGFSKTATDINGDELMLSYKLANYIAEALDYSDESDPEAINDLQYMSDLLTDHPSKIPSFISKMKELFSVTTTSTYQNNICSLPWKHFYTTNYDDSIQLACKSNKKVTYTLRKSDKYQKFPEPYVMHLNGHIDDLNEESILSDFKLTKSSYVSVEGFIETPWGTLFTRDVQYAPAIVFVGYSLYDFDIEKILIENNQTSKDRIYFITKPDITNRDKRKLEKFGKVINIGVEGFSDWVMENHNTLDKDNIYHGIKCFELYSPKNTPTYSISDLDILNFLTYGTISQEYLEQALRADSPRKTLIYRDKLNFILEKVKDGHNIVITSELGNGKSIFLESLAFLITRDLGGNVYLLPENLTEFDNPYHDLDYLKTIPKTVYLFIDGYNDHLSIIEYIKLKDIQNIRVIMSARNALHEKNGIHVTEYLEVNLDVLTDNEVQQIIELIDYIGHWADLIENTTLFHKESFIKNKNNSMISSILLSLLKSQHIRHKIQELVDPLFNNLEFKEIVFTICLLSLLGKPSDEYIISQMLNDDSIYRSKLKQNDQFKQLFEFEPKRRLYTAHSSIFSLTFIANHYEPTYIINKLIHIVKNLDKYGSADKKLSDIKTQILRFSFIERALPEKNKKSNLNTYYDLLKQEVSWIKYDPHYWLQYAMAQITLNDYGKAQTYLSQAYTLAKNKVGGYDTSYIDTQQARLYLKQSLEEVNALNVFLQGHRLLMSVPNEIPRYRQQSIYEEFYNVKYKLISKGEKVQFEHACNEVLQDIEKFKRENNRSLFMDKITTIFERITSSIKSARSNKPS